MRLISSILFLTISVLLFFFLIDPLYGDVKELRTNVSTYNSALNNSTELQKTRDELVDKYKQITDEDKDRLSHLLPDTINNIELILEIEKIANIHGMPIGEIKFDTNIGVKTNSTSGETGNTSANGKISAETDPSSHLPYGIFPVSFSVEGRYDVFMEFLDDLENNLRMVDVKSVSFSVPDASSAEGSGKGSTADSSIYRYSLKVETYWLK